MDIAQLCDELEKEFGFTGDILDLDDTGKEFAIRKYLTHVETNFDDLFPIAIGNIDNMIDRLYHDPFSFQKAWQHATISYRFANKKDIPWKDVLEMCFQSKALKDGVKLYDLCFDEDPFLFAQKIADLFHEYIEGYLRMALYDEYKCARRQMKG